MPTRPSPFRGPISLADLPQIGARFAPIGRPIQRFSARERSTLPVKKIASFALFYRANALPVKKNERDSGFAVFQLYR